MEQPAQLTLAVMDLRSYAKAKEIVDDPDTTSSQMPDHPMIDAVWEITEEMVKERRGRT